MNNTQQWSSWLKPLYRLRRDKRGSHGCPHKPVLVLSIIDLLDRGMIAELLRRNQLRNMRMIELGWDVMRFWVYQLRDEMPACVQRVKDWLENRNSQ